MPKIEYKKIKFTPDRLDIILFINGLVQEYARERMQVTARTIYYRLVTMNRVKNSLKSYKWVASLINDGRIAGIIDWNHITDMTREVWEPSEWDSPEDSMQASVYWYRIPKWDNQDYYPMVLIEKDALKGVFMRPCNEYQVPLLSCRGYNSQTEMWKLAQRLERRIEAGQQPIVFHFGDHDPSGVNMTEDIIKRLEFFVGESVEVRRIALTTDQIHEFNPPPNPAKIKDPRARAYIAEHGESSWELDALDPYTLRNLLVENIESVRDEDKLAESVAEEEEGKRIMLKVTAHWGEVVDWIESEYPEQEEDDSD